MVCVTNKIATKMYSCSVVYLVQQQKKKTNLKSTPKNWCLTWNVRPPVLNQFCLWHANTDGKCIKCPHIHWDSVIQIHCTNNFYLQGCWQWWKLFWTAHLQVGTACIQHQYLQVKFRRKQVQSAQQNFDILWDTYEFAFATFVYQLLSGFYNHRQCHRCYQCVIVIIIVVIIILTIVAVVIIIIIILLF